MNPRNPLVRPGIDVHQYYTLDVPLTESAALADIYSFTGTRGMGEPTKYVIQFTHPQRDLPRSGYINREASFVVQPPLASEWSEPEAPRRIYGMITGFAQIASNHDETMYEVILESRLALLRNTPRTRFFFDLSEPEIIEKILAEHRFDKIISEYKFELFQAYRKRPVITQCSEDDLAFITRLCRRVGIWFVCEAGKDHEIVRFGDDVAHYARDPNRFTAPYREPCGLHTTGGESVLSLAMRSKVIPAKFSVRSYSPEERNNDWIDGDRSINEDSTVCGEACTWGLDLDDVEDAAREATLRQEVALAEQVVYTGACDMLDMAPSCVLKLSNRKLPEVRGGLLIVNATCSASRKKGYTVAFTAIPDDRQFRMPLMEATWPRVHGVMTGKVKWIGRYRAWGATTKVARATPDPMEVANAIRFQGQYHDAETGLHYNRHRYYAPDTGRFISKDPVGLAGGINAYVYAPNPTGWVDPLGLAGDDVYRAMKTGSDGFPIAEPTARGLGARPNVDIPVGFDGMVHPGTGGISVAPGSAANLSPHRRPASMGGTGKDCACMLNTANLPKTLRYVQDSANHGTIQPSTSMSLPDYQAALASTRGKWVKQ
ncbi:MAG TPA: contractile injection system protein, VgrG/Pvc8 family [Paraburkholderia sp.]|nr:contractile injection system protein, VgrG/Pvc8 family [Paraburkholderia sp.]